MQHDFAASLFCLFMTSKEKPWGIKRWFWFCFMSLFFGKTRTDFVMHFTDETFINCFASLPFRCLAIYMYMGAEKIVQFVFLPSTEPSRFIETWTLENWVSKQVLYVMTNCVRCYDHFKTKSIKTPKDKTLIYALSLACRFNETVNAVTFQHLNGILCFVSACARLISRQVSSGCRCLLTLTRKWENWLW